MFAKVRILSDNGCIDNYEPVSDTVCVRVSSYPETYEDAAAKCFSEGGYLFHDINEEVHVSILLYFFAC